MQTEENISLRYGRAPLIRLFFPLYFFVVKWVRSSRLLTRILFHTRLPKGIRISWDFTTLVLRRALKKHCKAGSSVLEIGVGNGALLCIFLARRFGILPDGVDVAPERVESARRIVSFNLLSLDIRQSDLFAEVRQPYDLIFFNSVYIPTGFGETHELERRRQYDDTRGWDGGADGTETIDRFLSQAKDALSEKGNVLLGVNNFYLPDAHVKKMIDTHKWKLIDRTRMALNPSSVYILTPQREDPNE
jgi:methylase of polypeptide subunit release factors